MAKENTFFPNKSLFEFEFEGRQGAPLTRAPCKKKKRGNNTICYHPAEGALIKQLNPSDHQRTYAKGFKRCTYECPT